MGKNCTCSDDEFMIAQIIILGGPALFNCISAALLVLLIMRIRAVRAVSEAIHKSIPELIRTVNRVKISERTSDTVDRIIGPPLDFLAARLQQTPPPL